MDFIVDRIDTLHVMNVMAKRVSQNGYFMQHNFQCVQFITVRSCSWQVPCRDYTNSCLKQISNVYYVIKLREALRY
jgi:hypothetical protein